jgi:hypothetical protein
MNGVRVNGAAVFTGVDVTAFVSVALIVLVGVNVRVDVRVDVRVVYVDVGIAIVLDIAKRVLLGFIVGVPVDNGTTVNAVVAVALGTLGVNTTVAMGLGGVVLL